MRTLTIATAGTATIAPMGPARVLPNSTARMATTGEIEIRRPWTNGNRTLPVSCCRPITSSRVRTACAGDCSMATPTIAAPPMNGPTTGIICVRNANVPRASANGTPMSVRPTVAPIPVTAMISSWDST